MTQQKSLALIGYWHVHAQDYAAEIAARTDARIVTSWDPDATFGETCAADLGVPFTEDLDAILSDSGIDGVIVTTATSQHDDIIGRALAAGKHVFTEKLLSPTVDGCEALVAAAERAGVALVTSLPRLTDDLAVTIRRIVDSGDLGEVTYTRVRLAHDGWVSDWLPERFTDRSQAVGGALTDIGCHAIYLTQSLLGEAPDTVSATYGHVTGRDLEDHAVVTLGYPGGRIGVAEASNVTTPGASALEVRGTRGTLIAGFAGRGLLAKGDAFDPENWVDVPRDDALLTPMELWFAAMDGKASTQVNGHAATELTRLVVAANTAAAEQRTLSYSPVSA